MQHCVHAEGCNSTRFLGTTFCAARRGGQGCFKAESDFSPFVPNFSFVPSREREKSGLSRNKNGTEGKIRSQVPDHWTEGVEGAGPGQWAGPGWGPGPGRVAGDVRVPI